LVDKDILDCVVFKLDRDDHGVILLVINAMKVIVCKGNERHAAPMVGVGYVVKGLELAKMLLSSGGGGPATSKAARDGVNCAA